MVNAMCGYSTFPHFLRISEDALRERQRETARERERERERERPQNVKKEWSISLPKWRQLVYLGCVVGRDRAQFCNSSQNDCDSSPRQWNGSSAVSKEMHGEVCYCAEILKRD